VENKNINNIEEINRDLQQSFIHYDPNRVDYTINNYELDILAKSGNSIWKDTFIAAFGLGIPTALNGLSIYSKLTKEDTLGADIFFNFLFAGISISLGIICFFIWKKNSKSFKGIIDQIKNKPKYRIPSKQDN
jgi:hypothetical protein